VSPRSAEFLLLNQRRTQLIFVKMILGLNAKEEAELERLQAQTREALKPPQAEVITEETQRARIGRKNV